MGTSSSLGGLYNIQESIAYGGQWIGSEGGAWVVTTLGADGSVNYQVTNQPPEQQPDRRQKLLLLT